MDSIVYKKNWCIAKSQYNFVKCKVPVKRDIVVMPCPNLLCSNSNKLCEWRCYKCGFFIQYSKTKPTNTNDITTTPSRIGLRNLNESKLNQYNDHKMNNNNELDDEYFYCLCGAALMHTYTFKCSICKEFCMFEEVNDLKRVLKI
jgi:hypothetical protein